jgi:WD40 repeat protein
MIAMFFFGGLLFSCGSDSYEGKLIVTQVPEGYAEGNTITGENWRYLDSAAIIVVDPDKPDKAKVLTPGFYSACSPYVSWDGSYLLFAGRQKKEEVWQIWKLDLKGSELKKITDFKENCTDPVYMPNDRIVFSRNIEDSITGSAHALFSCKTDGSDFRQITFHPHANFATSVMADGRLLTITRQLYPEIKDQMIMVVRPDGTKADMFYKANNSSLSSRVREDENKGKLFFIESDSLEHDIISIDYNRPEDSRNNLTSNTGGAFYDVCPVDDHRLIVVWKENSEKNAALYEFEASTGKTGQLIYGNDQTEILDVTLVRTRPRPKKLPSEVDMGVKTGQVMCQDINFTGTGIDHNSKIAMIADRVEIMGIDSLLGIVPVESDGSIYLKISADKPFRIRTLSKDGRVVNGPGVWLWMRPNERRGCIGCHEDRNLVPENLVPLAVKKAPVNIPFEITGQIEKKAELE